MRIESAVSVKNSSNTALGANAVFSGSWESLEGFPSVVVASLADQDGTLYVDFSDDGITSRSTLTFVATANLNEVHRLTATRKYYRVRYANGAVAQGSFTLQATMGPHNLLSSPLNSQIQQDADAIVARTFGEEISMMLGYFQGFSIANKYGRNSAISTGTVPEDICDAGGTINWPTAAEKAEVFSSSASDAAAGTGARTLFISGLDANYEPISETITLNGVTGVQSLNSYLRIFFCYVTSAGTGLFNAGNITVRQATTTANVFYIVQAGTNNGLCTQYTVRAGYTAYIKRLHGSIRGSGSAACDIGILVREFGGAWRIRRPTVITQSVELDDTLYGGLRVPEKSDIVLRCTSASANNLDVTAGYDLVLAKNTA